MASKQILFKDAVIDDDKGAMSQDDAPDKEVGNDSFEFSDGKGVIKFEQIETCRRLVTTDYEHERCDETPESYAESVDMKATKTHSFMDSRRRANCCSRLTFYYANSLV